MGTYYTKDEHGKVNGIMTVPNVYQYKGFTFELHTLFGPIKVKKDFNPSACMGRKFFKVFDEWNKLSDVEKLDTQIFG